MVRLISISYWVDYDLSSISFVDFETKSIDDEEDRGVRERKRMDVYFHLSFT